MRARLAALFLATAATAPAAVFDFPTENRTLISGNPEDFYMYVDRDFEGQISKPWEGGQFGFVRGPRRDGGEVVCATLHEGIDIRPLRRDAAGNPLDDVVAAAAGVVVHASSAPGASNYGRYVVVEHRLEGSPFYTLYAHLASVAVAPGQQVRQGELLGRLGFTGAGIDRTRAHLHFEIGLMLSRDFEGWHQSHLAGSPNVHGLFNGLNLIGTDPAAVLRAAAKSPDFRLSGQIASQEPVYKITVRNSPHLSILSDYPWLVPPGEEANPPAWTISFAGHGLPLRAVACKDAVTEPRLEWVKATSMSYAHATKGFVAGPPGSPHLTDAGKRFAKLLTWPD